jgi:hypothetical protein
MRRRTYLLLLVLAATIPEAQTEEKSSSETRSHIEARRLTDAELTAYGKLDQAARATNEPLLFQLLNLTGTTFRTWYCAQPSFDDKVVLARLLARARLPQEQKSLFERWYAAEIRFSGHNAAVWRAMQVESLMRATECSEDKLASARDWIERHGNPERSRKNN